MNFSLANMSTRAKQITAICALAVALFGAWSWFESHFAKAETQRQILDIVQDIQKQQMKLSLREDDREYRVEQRSIETEYGIDCNKMPSHVRERYLNLREKRKNLAAELEELK